MFKKSACFPPPKDAEHPPESFGVGDFFKSPRGLCALGGSTQPIHAPRNRKHCPQGCEASGQKFCGFGSFFKSSQGLLAFGLCLSPDNIRGGFFPFFAAVSFRLPASAFRIVEFMVYCICIVFHKKFLARILQSKANII